jgi:hypothetical protein
VLLVHLELKHGRRCPGDRPEGIPMRARKIVVAALAAVSAAALIAVASSCGLVKSVAEQDSSTQAQHQLVLAAAQPSDWHWFDE